MGSSEHLGCVAPVPKACCEWQPALEFDGIWLGTYPALNAVVALNRFSAAAWDALQGSSTYPDAARIYADLVPERAIYARADIWSASLDWHGAGLFASPTPRLLSSIDDIDRSSGTHFALEIYGVPIEIVIRGGEMTDLIRETVAGFQPASRVPHEVISITDAQNDIWSISACGFTTTRIAGLGLARNFVINRILQIAMKEIGLAARLHGAVLSKGDGKCILLTGAGGSGKTTLASVLLTHGWRLVAEDLAPIDCSGRVFPFPFPLSIKSSAWSFQKNNFPSLMHGAQFTFGERTVRYAALSPDMVETNPCELTGVFQVKWEPSKSCRVSELSPSDALFEFLTKESVIDWSVAGGSAIPNLLSRVSRFAIQYPDSETALDCIASLV